jgi:hypothetical protein
MKVPHADEALVPKQKVVEYLLSTTHRDGRSKATFFARFGFSAATSDVFAEALRRHVAEHHVVEVEETQFGTSYVVEGALVAPDGRLPVVRVVWFIEVRNAVPRLVTAYPAKGAKT